MRSGRAAERLLRYRAAQLQRAAEACLLHLASSWRAAEAPNQM